VPGPVIALYSADVPPVPGGVADHTLALARALDAAGHRPFVFAGRGDGACFGPVPCATGVPVRAAPFEARAAGAEWLLLQYVPFLYARRGVAPALWRLGGACRRAGVRLAVFMHEPFVPLTRPVWLVTGPLQRLQLHLLVRGVTQVFTSVPHWVQVVKRYGGDPARVTLAPVGATIPVSGLPRSEARARLGLGDDRVAIGIFSPAASGFAHDWIRAATTGLGNRSGVTWVRFGYGSARALPGYPAGADTVTVGASDPARIADTMMALDLLVAPYEDGLTLRRTGAMLGLASGVATLSSTGHLFDPAMHRLAACEPDIPSFVSRLERLVADPGERAALAARTAAYGTLASTGALARLLIATLPAAAGGG
jgi:hypothetical protein